ncbi:MAG: tetratricopeptide repeat protein, partial [Salaquimonas sp.]
ANGDDPAAIDNYRNAITFDPENVNMKQSLFMALTADGRIADAIELLKTIPPEEQTQNVIHVVTAANALKQKSWSRVQTSMDKVSGSDLDNMVTSIVAAWGLFGERKLPEALERVATITGPEWVMMIKEYHLGLLNAAGAKDADAVVHFTKAVEMRRVAGALSETYMRAVEGLARAQAKVGDMESASQTVDTGLDLLNNHPPLVNFKEELTEAQKKTPLVKTAQQGGAEIFFNVGSAISRQGGLPFAQGHLQLARFLAPQNDVVLLALANTYSDQKKYERANELYRNIEESSGYYRRAQVETGLNLNRMDQVPMAEEILSKMVAEDPKDVVTALSLGSVYGQHEQFEKAAALYDSVIKQIGAPQERDWILLYRRGIANERLKKWPLAEADFKKALELAPDQPDVLNYLGYSWIDQGINLEEGLDMVKKAVELRPNSGFIIDSLGWAYYRLGRYEDAVTELLRAVELMPSDPVVNDHLGDAFWKTDRKLEAVFQWKHALSNDPNDEDKANIEKKLQTGLTH